MDEQRPKVGVGIMIMKGGQVLLSRRKTSHGTGQYAFPGGHLEYMESFYTCAKREIAEECGVEIKNIRFLFLANLKKYSPKHYVHIGLIADWAGGEPQILEPEKSEAWHWYRLDQLPDNLFETCRLSIESLRTDKNYFDA